MPQSAEKTTSGRFGVFADHRVHTLIVALAPEALARVRRRSQGGHSCSCTCLLSTDRRIGSAPSGGAEAPEILPHVLHRIAPADAQVQRIPGRGADAAGPRGKAVADSAGIEDACSSCQSRAPSALMGQNGHGLSFRVRRLPAAAVAYTSCRSRRGRDRCGRSS